MKYGGRTGKLWSWIIAIVSGAIVAVIAYLMFGPRTGGGAGQAGGMDVSGLPALNATLNAVTGVLLVIGFALIKSGYIRWHRAVMLAAFATSAAFLVSYVTYHAFIPGPHHYVGAHRTFYLSVLVSHIIGAAVILPLALTTLYRGWTAQIPKHRRIAKFTLPLWLYVSITGVVVYAMLYTS